MMRVLTGDDTGRGGSAAHHVEDAVPDRHEQNAAAAAAVKPVQYNRAARQAEDETDVLATTSLGKGFFSAKRVI